MCRPVALVGSPHAAALVALLSFVPFAIGCESEGAARATGDVQGDAFEAPDGQTAAETPPVLARSGMTDPIVSPAWGNLLACTVSFKTETPARVWVELGEGSRRTLRISSDAEGTEHKVLVVGMRQRTLYTLDVHAQPLDGSVRLIRRVTYKTLALPKPMLTPEVLNVEPERDPGYWINVSPLERSTTAEPTLHYMYDASGAPVWYAWGIPGMFMSQTATGLFVSSPWPYEMQLDGQVSWINADLKPKGTSFGQDDQVTEGDIHHDLQPLTNGDIAVIRYDVRDGFYSDHVDIVGRDGSLKWRWDVLDHVVVSDSGDVTHGNAVYVNEEAGTVLFSAAMVNTIFQVSPSIGRPSGCPAVLRSLTRPGRTSPRSPRVWASR